MERVNESGFRHEKVTPNSHPLLRRRVVIPLLVLLFTYLVLCVPRPYATDHRYASVQQVTTPKTTGVIVFFSGGYSDFAMFFGGIRYASVEVDSELKEYRITPFQWYLRFPGSPASVGGHGVWLQDTLRGGYPIKILSKYGGYVEIGRMPNSVRPSAPPGGGDP